MNEVFRIKQDRRYSDPKARKKLVQKIGPNRPINWSKKLVQKIGPKNWSKTYVCQKYRHTYHITLPVRIFR